MKVKRMTEFEVVNLTKTPNTVSSIINDLKIMGVRPEDTLLVHSSLSSIGWVCGGEQALIQALLETVTKDGTICMPAHSGVNSNPEEWQNPPVPKEWNEIIYNNFPAFNKRTTPTCGLGNTPELFRSFSGTLRSNHPQVSFCANGKSSLEITKEHSLTPQFGMDSPVGKLYNLKSRVLLIGTGYESCSCFHLGEALSKKMLKKKMGAAIEVKGKRKWEWFYDYDYDNSDFEQLGESFEKENKNIISGSIGNSICKLFSIKEAVDFSINWFEKSRIMS
jgi:aminoglycoside 3-N-acetyltransferase